MIARRDRAASAVASNGRARRWWWVILAVAAGLAVALPGVVFGVAYAHSGRYGVNVVLRRGMTTWSATGPDDPRLTPGMRLALSPTVPPATLGTVSWQTPAPGFEVADVPVLAEGREVDRLLLSRLDPARYRFEVLSRPAGDRELGDWLEATGAALVVNGSYFADNGTPDTPIVSRGVPAGPTTYRATHGAFVAGPGGTRLVDLAGSDWTTTLAGADNALVSYPLLIGADGASRAAGSSPEQLANRSFLAQDTEGRVLVGTTTDAFLSLARLADVLRAAPLALRLALNLDGGPVACQGVRLDGWSRDFCGRWETANHDGHLELLGQLFGHRRAGLPLVVTATPLNG